MDWRKSSFSGAVGNCVEVRWRKSSFSAESGDCVEVSWQKSSFSGTGGDCVEVGWRKSSFSGTGGNCVEISQGLASIRDSKNPDGPTLTVQLAPLLAFLTAARTEPEAG